MQVFAERQNGLGQAEISAVRSNKCGFGGQIVLDLPVILRRIEQNNNERALICEITLAMLYLIGRKVNSKSVSI